MLDVTELCYQSLQSLTDYLHFNWTFYWVPDTDLLICVLARVKDMHRLRKQLISTSLVMVGFRIQTGLLGLKPANMQKYIIKSKVSTIKPMDLFIGVLQFKLKYSFSIILINKNCINFNSFHKKFISAWKVVEVLKF